MSYSYDNRGKIAAGKDYADYLKEADRLFLGEVAKKINSSQRYIKARVKDGVSVIFLIFEGVDSSDMELEGHASTILLDHNTVKFYVEWTSAFSGRGENEQRFKSGQLTVDLAADMVLEPVG